MKLIKILLVLVLLTSCGARKSSVSIVDAKIDSIAKVNEKLSQVSEKIETSLDTTSIIEEEFIPIDSTKEMIVDKKNGVYKNVRFKTSRTKKAIQVTKNNKSVLDVKKNTLNEVSMDIESKDKETDKKESFSSWIWLFIIIGLVLAYIEFKRK